jgi:hypothetical protein
VYHRGSGTSVREFPETPTGRLLDHFLGESASRYLTASGLVKLYGVLARGLWPTSDLVIRAPFQMSSRPQFDCRLKTRPPMRRSHASE